LGLLLERIQDIPDFDEKFRSMCLYYADLLAKEGVRVRPFRSLELPVFSKLKGHEKQSVIAQVSTVLEVFEEVLAKDGSLKDSNKMVWRALSKLGWVSSSDIFSHMEDGDVICFHDAQQRMVFQTLPFFDWVSYTLEDLYGGLWYTHSRREDAVAREIYEFAVELFAGAHQESVEPGMPEHIMHEVDTEEMLKIWIKIKRACPLKSNGQITGMLVINRCRWVE
jgi:hypothetical protein